MSRCTRQRFNHHEDDWKAQVIRLSAVDINNLLCVIDQTQQSSSTKKTEKRKRVLDSHIHTT
jgi:hypothetical protein